MSEKYAHNDIHRDSESVEISTNTPNKETIDAMLEAERIASDHTVKGYTDTDILFADLKDNPEYIRRDSMNIDKWIIAHFSPTGGTKKVADAIAAGFNTPVVEMDLTKEDSAITLGEYDALMAVLPVYAGRVPQISRERLSALKGNGQKAVAVVVYGNREYDDALLETKDALEANGFQVIAAAAFIAEHSIVRSIANRRPDAQDEAICRQFAADVMAKADDAASVQVPGNSPYKELKPSAFHPAASESCVKCGACSQQCPLGAIPLEEPSQTNNDLCINCMRCVQVCPQQCRALPDAFLTMVTQMLKQNAAGYKKPAVFL